MALTRILILEYNQTLRKKLSEKFREEYPRLNDQTIQSYLDRFKELKHRFPMDKRDVTKLKWDEVEHLVDGFTSTRAKLGTVKIASEDGNLVYDNGKGIRIFHGKDKDACIKYSTGYTFCIGSKSEDRNQYNFHRTKIGGGSPYFVVNQNLPNTHKYHISVVYCYYDKPEFFAVTNAKNNKETRYDSKQELKQFYEEQFNVKLDNKFVDVIVPIKVDIVNEIIKPIDKGSYYLSEGDVNLSKMNLKTLKFFDKPWIVEGDFECSFNQLTTLEGAPRKVGGNFGGNNSLLKTLKGAPQQVGGNFTCAFNQLTTLEGAPQKVGGDFYCMNAKLTTLEGAPQEVGGGFYCQNNQLQTLKGAPRKVGGDFYCSENQLTTLEGAPQRVVWGFDCDRNQLTTLEGAPQEVEGLYCSRNQLTTLKGAPQKVRGDFYCKNNPNLPQEEIDRYLRSIGKL